MKELTKDEVRGLGHAVGLEIQDPELTEVAYTLLSGETDGVYAAKGMS